MKLSLLPEIKIAAVIEESRSMSSKTVRISSARPRLNVLTGAPGTSSERIATPASRVTMRAGMLSPSLHDHRVSHPARGTDGHEAEFAIAAAKLVDERR